LCWRAGWLEVTGRVDVVIDGAGEIEIGPFEALAGADFHRAMGTTFCAERAARPIVRAIERGEALVFLGLPAKLAAKAQGLALGAIAWATQIVARALPSAADAGAPSAGRSVRSPPSSPPG
jgi:hypothetical protein